MASVSDDVALTMDDMPLGEDDRRNGYRERRLRTVIGEIVLRVPKLREDTYFPERVTRPYSRVGRAMVGVVSRVYVNGMSARRIEKVAGGLEFGRSGPSTVSRMLASLDGEVDALRQGEFDAGSPVPYLWLDAAYVKCRDDDSRVCSRATVTAIGAFMDGTRRFVGFDLVDTESYDSWKRFLPSLRKRGVGGVRLVTSDAREDALAHLAFHREHWVGLRINNVLERANAAIKRRTRAVRIFPSRESLIRLVGAVLVDMNETWTRHRFMSADDMKTTLDPGEKPCVKITAETRQRADQITMTALESVA
ncbi:transposase [Bifidobacterium pseudolongum subsp. globosum]|uniref:transposase n=1 Tax=Bifidobacterium pseudolongum TaxID=1694 RepID=UPI0010F293D4|nr:transposase [Bifidobacterium pseudolongum]RYP94900.1 transposase [Bifidobacterium pseudolongum subsp. globosum]